MEMTSYLQAAGGLIFVLGLIALAAFFARKLGLASSGRWRDDKRLQIVETMALDPKRRVLLIQCDATEHLVLLGPSTETVLSSREPERFVAKPPAPRATANTAPEQQPTVSLTGPALVSKAAGSTAFKSRPDALVRREPSFTPIRRDPK